MILWGKIWRAASAICDWRAILRALFGQPLIDVVFITNIRDKTDVERFLGRWIPPLGHFNGPRYWIKGIAGRTRAIYSLTDDLLTVEGRRDAKKKFIAATQWAEKQGAKIILLAAGTKRLFGEDGAELKNLFPGVIFTIGDNGTTLVLKAEVLRALGKAGLNPGSSRIGILGAYGFLGELMTKTLKSIGYNIIGVGPNTAGLEEIGKKYVIETCTSLGEMGQVDCVVACTHSERIRLTQEAVNHIRREGRKLLVLDVAEPANFRKREYLKCRDFVLRQDAGNAYSPYLKNVLGAITYTMFRLTKGVVFGCFAEALVLAWAIQHGYGQEVIKRDWFIVGDENMEFVGNLFKKTGFTIPSPRCFSKPVSSFDLVIEKNSICVQQRRKI